MRPAVCFSSGTHFTLPNWPAESRGRRSSDSIIVIETARARNKVIQVPEPMTSIRPRDRGGRSKNIQPLVRAYGATGFKSRSLYRAVIDAACCAALILPTGIKRRDAGLRKGCGRVAEGLLVRRFQAAKLEDRHDDHRAARSVCDTNFDCRFEDQESGY